MAHISYRRCKACGEKYELFQVRTEWVRMTHEDVEGLDCPACGDAEHDILLSRGPSPHRNRADEEVLYPYYNNALGVMLESKEHKARILKERNLVEAPGFDFGVSAAEADDRTFERRKKERERERLAYKQSPDFAEHRRIEALQRRGYK